jgi:predicted Ser/Thr protein kinase
MHIDGNGTNRFRIRRTRFPRRHSLRENSSSTQFQKIATAHLSIVFIHIELRDFGFENSVSLLRFLSIIRSAQQPTYRQWDDVVLPVWWSQALRKRNMPAERAQRIEQLYHDARKRDPGQRAGFLEQACAGDEGLRREVESLLAEDDGVQSFLRQVEELYHAAREDRAALNKADPELRHEVELLLAQDGRPGRMEQLPLQAPVTLLPDSTVTPLAVGALLGPYKIEARIGAGGMGQVYRAADARLDRKVAIKISAQQFSARFEREARAISALNHPHICTLYDVGPNYLVMELVEGETLSDRLRKGPFPLDQAVKYAGQICDALDAAHKKGITHRDLKPGNVMVTKNGVKVLDFGLAKSQQDETLTASRAIMGTPAYMAPEQNEGKECDARTDIYALGLVLREMATGHRDGATLDLPPHLSHAIDRCLEKDPDDRWQSAHDIKLAVGQCSSFVPSDRPGGPRYWPLVAVLAVAAVVAAVGWWRVTSPCLRVFDGPASVTHRKITKATGFLGET